MAVETATNKLAQRYERMFVQFAELVQPNPEPLSRMATAVAILHHKLPHFFWTGFYLDHGGKLVVGPYQGPLACNHLEPGKGVCWAAYESGQTQLVPSVHEFPGHIACDSRSQSEVVVPVRDRQGMVRAVFDVDSEQPDAFSEVDAQWLERFAALIYADSD